MTREVLIVEISVSAKLIALNDLNHCTVSWQRQFLSLRQPWRKIIPFVSHGQADVGLREGRPGNGGRNSAGIFKFIMMRSEASRSVPGT
jgi:hypothetical protein